MCPSGQTTGGHKCLPVNTTGGDTSVFPVKLQGGTQVSFREHYRGDTSVFPVKRQGDTQIISSFLSESYGGEGGHLGKKKSI